MKRAILPSIFWIGLIYCTSARVNAQNNTGFAITGATKGDIGWMVIRQIDLTTGKELRTIYTPGFKTRILDARNGQQLQEMNYNIPVTDEVNVNRNGITSTVVTYATGVTTETVTAPTETSVAASAYDRRSNRLFFTPMHSNELRYFDLNTGANSVYYVRNTPLRSFVPAEGEADVITRMCLASDGSGYALTNDARHLIRFSTSGNISITDLGPVADGSHNNDISLRNMCTSWGGDMIGDIFGNLYLISMRGNVFKINTRTMVADFVTQIKNLPEDYTVNGAAVDAKGTLLISSALKTDHYYTVNISTWEATPLADQHDAVYNASDLASAHLAFENLVTDKTAVAEKKQLIRVFPNPVVNQSLRVLFEDLPSGEYHLQLMNEGAQLVLDKRVQVYGKYPADILLPSSLAAGLYILQVKDAHGNIPYTGKIVVN